MSRMVDSFADDLVGRLRDVFEGAREPERAVRAAAYMRDQFSFLGLDARRQRELARTVLEGVRRPDEKELKAVVRACWALPEREYQYFACDYLRAYAKGPSLLAPIRRLITTKSWWDTVDPLATRVVGDLVRHHARLTAQLDEWVADENKWLVRTAILHQLHYGVATDTERLFGYCTRQAGHPDFFVRKAIGWALRHYARTDPGAVRGYLDDEGWRLSALSVREAAKRL
jgi:3-methyladenine DNA glycosylase AlkD